MNNFIFELKYNFNRKLLLKEFDESNLSTFSSLNLMWERAPALGNYSKSIVEFFSEMVRGRVFGMFYNQPENTTIKPHKDTACKAKINIVLNDDDSLIVIEDQQIAYKTALLNVNEFQHSVTKTKFGRKLFSVVFLDTNFYEVREAIMKNKHINIELDPADREWEYDGDGNKIYKPEAGFSKKTVWEESEKSLDNQDKR